MTIPYPLFMQNNDYPAKLVRQLIRMNYFEGVMSLAEAKVTQRSAGANFSVDVSAFVSGAIVDGDDQTGQGSYFVTSDAIENVVISPAPGSNSRYDLIVLQIQDPNATGPAGDNAVMAVVTGTASGSPALPTLPDSALLLAVVGPITSATSSITNSLIHDAQTGTGPTGVANAHRLAGERGPAGTPMDWYGPSSTIPNGWLLRDGSSLLRSAYPALFAVLGTTHGAADGTHFNLPDDRGRVSVGLDNMGGSDAGRLTTANTLGTTMGTETVTLSSSEMPAHVHSVDPPTTAISASTSISDPGHAHNIAYSDPANAGNGTDRYTVGGSGNTTTSPAFTGITASTTGTVDIAAFNSASTGSGGAHSNMQPSITVNKIIRTG